MNKVVIHIIVDNVTDDEAIAIKHAIEKALEKVEKKEIEVSLRHASS